MNVSQCDTCRALGALVRGYAPDGWVLIHTMEQERGSGGLVSALSGGSPMKTAGSFCSWKCAAEYCVARTLLAEEASEAP